MPKTQAVRSTNKFELCACGIILAVHLPLQITHENFAGLHNLGATASLASTLKQFNYYGN